MIRKARVADAKAIHKLVNHFADKDQMLARSLSDAYDRLREFSVWDEGGEVLACVGLRIVWEDLAEVRDRGWLAEGNITDLDARRSESETGELVVDGPRDVLVLNTPATAGGYAPAGESTPD